MQRVKTKRSVNIFTGMYYLKKMQCGSFLKFWKKKKSYGLENIRIDEGRMQLAGNVAGMEGNAVRQSCGKKTCRKVATWQNYRREKCENKMGFKCRLCIRGYGLDSVQNRDQWRTVFTASEEEPDADFVQLTQNVTQWLDSFHRLRIRISGGLRSTDSECRSVVDFIQLTQNVAQWLDSFHWLIIRISGGLRSTDSECGSVADFVQQTQNVDQWRHSFNWLTTGISGGLRSTDSKCRSVVDFVQLTQNVDQWWALFNWLKAGNSGGIHSIDSKCGLLIRIPEKGGN